MKKTLATFLSFAMLLSITACKAKTETPDTPDSTEITTSATEITKVTEVTVITEWVTTTDATVSEETTTSETTIVSETTTMPEITTILPETTTTSPVMTTTPVTTTTMTTTTATTTAQNSKLYVLVGPDGKPAFAMFPAYDTKYTDKLRKAYGGNQYPGLDLYLHTCEDNSMYWCWLYIGDKSNGTILDKGLSSVSPKQLSDTEISAFMSVANNSEAYLKNKGYNSIDIDGNGTITLAESAICALYVAGGSELTLKGDFWIQQQ